MRHRALQQKIILIASWVSCITESFIHFLCSLQHPVNSAWIAKSFPLFFSFFFIPTGLPESLSVYFTGKCFIFLSLERRRRMRRIVSSSRVAFPRPTQVSSKSSLLFTLSSSPSSASFSTFSSPPFYSLFSSISIVLWHFILLSTLVFVLLWPQFLLLSCPRCPLISFFSSFALPIDLSFLVLFFLNFHHRCPFSFLHFFPSSLSSLSSMLLLPLLHFPCLYLLLNLSPPLLS